MDSALAHQAVEKLMRGPTCMEGRAANPARPGMSQVSKATPHAWHQQLGSVRFPQRASLHSRVRIYYLLLSY